MNLHELAKTLAAQQAPSPEVAERLTALALECRRAGYRPRSLRELSRLEDFVAWKRAGQLYDLERARRVGLAASSDPVACAQAQADLDGGQAAVDAMTQALADQAARAELEARRG